MSANRFIRFLLLLLLLLTNFVFLIRYPPLHFFSDDSNSDDDDDGDNDDNGNGKSGDSGILSSLLAALSLKLSLSPSPPSARVEDVMSGVRERMLVKVNVPIFSIVFCFSLKGCAPFFSLSLPSSSFLLLTHSLTHSSFF